jgi:transmembrane sensor
MNDQEITQLITKVLAGEATPSETQQLDDWRKQHPDNESGFQQTKLIWDNASLLEEEADTDAAWEKFSARLHNKPKTLTLTYYLRIAAAVILIGGAMLFLANLFGNSIQSVQTASNEIKEVKLPDGSIAWLNHDSKLEYEKDFDGEIRAITLNGEAFFEVVKNPSKPFVITSQHSVTTVLGTSFNLTAFDSVPEVTLTVATGRVSFVSTKTKAEVIVTANQSATISEAGEAKKPDETDANEMAWKTKKLSFNDAPLADVFKSLEHYFNLKITVGNENINNCHFTGEFDKPGFKQIMDVISKTLQLSYEQKARKVTVTGKGCE